MRQPPEIGVVLEAERGVARDAAGQLGRRLEVQYTFVVAGKVRGDDRVEGEEPRVAAVAEDRPNLSRAPRLLEALLDERQLPVDAGEGTGCARGRPQRQP